MTKTTVALGVGAAVVIAAIACNKDKDADVRGRSAALGVTGTLSDLAAQERKAGIASSYPKRIRVDYKGQCWELDYGDWFNGGTTQVKCPEGAVKAIPTIRDVIMEESAVSLGDIPPGGSVEFSVPLVVPTPSPTPKKGTDL